MENITQIITNENVQAAGYADTPSPGEAEAGKL